jgi:hypothetical protein
MKRNNNKGHYTEVKGTDVKISAFLKRNFPIPLKHICLE